MNKLSRNSAFLMFLWAGLWLAMSGCATEPRALRIVTSGSHVPQTDLAKPKESRRYVVWGNHAGMVGWLTQKIISEGVSIVERARLQDVLNEQKIRLTHTADDETDILRVGKLIGATHILFAEATVRPDTRHGAVITPAFGGASYAGTVYHLGVTIRVVRVDSGEIRLSGTAQYTLPVNDPEVGIKTLAQWASFRALCPLEKGYFWKEDDGLDEPPYGCIKPHGGE